MNREELKAHLMAQAEAAIEEILERKPDSAAITLTEIEQLALTGGKTFRETVLASLVKDSEQAEGQETVRCPECDQPMHYKGKRPKTIVTEAGEVRIERDYYYCAGCKHGVFPPG